MNLSDTVNNSSIYSVPIPVFIFENEKVLPDKTVYNLCAQKYMGSMGWNVEWGYLAPIDSLLVCTNNPRNIWCWYHKFLKVNTCLKWWFSLQCWETYVGQQIYKLIILDFLVPFVLTFIVEYPRRFVIHINLHFQQEEVSSNLGEITFVHSHSIP